MPAVGRPEPFAVVLRRARESAGLSQSQLAARAGLGVRTVSNLERGINTSPYPSTVALLADALSASEAVRAELVRSARRPEPTGSRPVGKHLGAAPEHPIVARDAERAVLLATLQAVRDASAVTRFVALGGEPGIGKTRLAQEATTYADERGFVVATGRCYRTQRGTPYAPFLEALASLYAAAPAGAREALPTAAQVLLPDAFPDASPDRADPATATARLHRGVVGLVRAVSADAPVVVLLDDLQWADEASLELLAHLVRHTTHEDRVCAVGTFRDVELDTDHPVRALLHTLDREGLVRTLSVRRLDAEETARLVAARLDAPASDDLSALVHRQSGGNPFFTVETVTSLSEQGALTWAGGRWGSGELAEPHPPAGVAQAIAERVSRLSPDAQNALVTLSVVGEVVEPDDLAVLDLDEKTLERTLDEAVASGLLSATRDRYAFDHALTVQALYAALSPVRARRLHARAAEVLGAHPEPVRERRAADLARHLEASGQPGRAVPHVLVAGRTAERLHSANEAARHYARAADLAAEAGDRRAWAVALERLAHVQQVTADFASAADHLSRASATYAELGEHAARLRVEGAIAQALHRAGDGEAAASRLTRVLETAGSAGSAPLALGLAHVRLGLGQPELALAATEDAVALASAAGPSPLEADAESLHGLSLLFLDRYDDAVAALSRAVALARSTGAVRAESSALMSLSWTALQQGRLTDHAHLVGQALEANRRCGDTDSEALNLASLGLGLFYAGDLDGAEAQLDAAVDLARAGSPTLFSGLPPLYLGVVLAGRGDLEGAEKAYDEASAAPDLQTFAMDGYLAARRAQLDLLRGDARSALDRLSPWLGTETPTRLHDVLLLATAAEACLALGQPERASTLAAHALRRADATGNGLEVDHARQMLAAALSALR